MRSLLPGVPDNALFEAIFIDLLPPNARDAAVKHDVLEEMAEAADKVLAEAPASQTVNSVAYQADGDQAVAQISRPRTSSDKKKSNKNLCYVHRNYGRAAFRCAAPETCNMRDIVSPQRQTPGNANAGRQ